MKAWGWLIGLVALAVRLVYLTHLEPYPRFELIRNRLDDQVFLDSWAKSIARDEPFSLANSPHEFAYWAARAPGVFPQAPLYPYFLALCYSLFGYRYDLVRALQLAGGSLAAWLVFRTGARIFGLQAGIIAGFAAALYGPFVFYESTFLIDALTVVFSALMLFLVATLGSARRVGAFLTGAVLGLACLLRPNFLLFAAFVLAALAPRRRLVPLLAGLLLMILPVIALNSARSGSLAFISSNAPFNFLIGNLHDAPGSVPTTTPAYLGLKEQSRSDPIDLWAAARDDILRHPAAFLRLQLRKIGFFFGGREIPNNLNYYLARQANAEAWWAPLELPLVLPLALVGMLLALQQRRRSALLYGFLLTYAASIIGFFVVSRLRQPAVLPLLLFAAYAVSSGVHEARRRRPAWPLFLLGVAVAGFFLLRPASAGLIRPVDYLMAAAAYRTRGTELEQDGRGPEARAAYLQALLFNPGDDDLVRRIRSLTTTPAWETPSETARELQRLWDEAHAHAQATRYDEAEAVLEQARRLAPESAITLQHLANVEFMRGRHDRVTQLLEQALRRDPGNPVVRHNLKTLRGIGD